MIRFEKAMPSDAAALTAIVIRAFNDETRRFGPGRDGGPPGYDSLDWTKGMIEGGYFYHKILLDGVIVGGCNVEKRGQGRYWLDLVYVDPDYHDRGIGTAAIKFVESSFPDAVHWSLETPHYSLRNHHLYEKLGYRKVGVAEDGFLFLYEKTS